MRHVFEDDAVMVTCKCGARIKIANPEFTDSVTCGGCGQRLTLQRAAVAPGIGHVSVSALVAAAEKGPIPLQVASANGFVQEGKLREALEVFEHVLHEQPERRDALYGKGYCLYKLGQAADAERALVHAHRLGHPSAIRLIRRIQSGPGDTAA